MAAGAAVDRALAYGLCGFGGALDPPPVTAEAAVRAAMVQHDERLARRIRRFAAAPVGAFVWTRDGDGLFWMGRLQGQWRYDARVGASRVDLVHVRPCQWLSDPVPDARVPGGVVSTFARGGRNWQQTHDAPAAAESARLWRKLGSAEAAPSREGHNFAIVDIGTDRH